MATTIKTRLVKIGNSQGVRIPKILLDQLALPTNVELEVQGQQLIVRPARHPRADWDAQFQQMAAQNDDHLLDGDTSDLSTWHEDEWVWE
jgi:antitoxin MazE